MKRIFAVLVVLAMVFGVALVANAETADGDFCGISGQIVDNFAISGKTATMKGGSNQQGYFNIPVATLGNGNFSIEFDYSVTTCDGARALNFEGRAANWFVIVLPNDGKHARLEGNPETGAYKFTVDGAVKDEGTSDALKGEWSRDYFKIGFTNTDREGDFEATVSNLVVNDKAAATGDVTAIVALVAVLAGGLLVFSKKH